MSVRWLPAFTDDAVVDAVLAGNEPPRDRADRMTDRFTTAGFERLRLYDRSGKLIWAPIGGDAPGELETSYFDALDSQEWQVDIHTHDPAGEKYLAEVYAPIRRNGEAVGAMEVRFDVTNGRAHYLSLVWVAMSLVAVMGAVGLAATGANAFLITRQRDASNRIYQLAHHDPLTGIANRNRFLASLDRALAGLKTRGGGVALHIIDLDGFKAVNDSLGHDAGDTLLRQVAARIVDCCDEADVVARLGGDEFAVIQRNVDTRDDAVRRAGAMLEAARAIRELDGVPVSVTLSIGIALAPEHATLSSELQKCADAAVYRAKSLRRDQCVVFEVGMDGELKTRNTIRVMLRRALEADEFELHYQPLHAADSSALLGFEALLRLKDGDGGYISPATFIPIAEDMGLTPQIGQWVLNEACRTAATWPKELSIAVNLSAQQFREDLVSVVESALALSGVAPDRLELEITESLFISEPASVAEQLHCLRALGVHVVMDDFGTGYSSLSHLWKFPFDKLKVDRSCFMSLNESESVGEVLRAISAMSGAMNLRVVAEGIETELQRTFACQAGYDELQGFLCGRPMPREAAEQFIRSATLARRDTEIDDIPLIRPLMLN